MLFIFVFIAVSVRYENYSLYFRDAIHVSIAFARISCCLRTAMPVSGIPESFSFIAIFSSKYAFKVFMLHSISPGIASVFRGKAGQVYNDSVKIQKKWIGLVEISSISFSNSLFPSSVREYTALSGIFPSFTRLLFINPFSSS